jgi:hypothetical protein
MISEIKVWMPEKGYKDADLGECIFVTDDFVTFATDYPPAALRSQQMWNNGWEVYVQPVLYTWVSANTPNRGYVTTYKRRTLK